MSNILMDFIDEMTATPGLDRFEQGKADPQCIDFYDNCDQCNGEIYYGEDYYSIDGEIICVDCIKDYAEIFKKVAGEE